MVDDLPPCYQMLHRSKECSNLHPQLFVTGEHCRFEACRPYTNKNPSCNDLYHKYNTSMIPYHFLILLLSRPRPMSFLSCIKLLMGGCIFPVTYILRPFVLLGKFSFSLLNFTILVALELKITLLLIIINI